MRPRLGALVLVAFAAAGCGSATQRAASPPAVVRAPRLPAKPPPGSVGTFPCPPHPGSTVDMEACFERRLFALDRDFNASVAALWPTLDRTARRGFAQSQEAWLQYMRSDCTMQARAYLGGTAAGVVAADCEEQRTQQRVREVRGTLALYCQGRPRTGRFRRCPRGGE